MPKVTDAYREARREEIAAAALRAFQRRGFQATSMADIITESGLSAGVIYNHFKSKSDIVIAVATRVVGRSLGELGELGQRRPMRRPGVLLGMILGHVIREVGSPGILVQIWGEAVTDPAIRALATEVMGRLRTMLVAYGTAWLVSERGLSPEAAKADATKHAPLLVAAAQGYIVQAALLDDFDSERFLDALGALEPGS